jgi:hypothetical protein
MKVLLRKTKTSLYYVGANQWTSDPKQARVFEQVEQAIQLQREERLIGVEVVLSYNDLLGDLVLPLQKPG